MPTYTAHLTRNHKTETRYIKPRFEDMPGAHRPIIAYEKVNVDFQRPVLTPEDFTEFRAAVIAAASVESEDWEPWSFKNAVENGDCPPPPAMLTPAKSLAGKAWRKQADHYFSLYGDNVYTPFRVLEHWFFTIGNGMYWDENGRYVSKISDKPKDKEKLAKERLTADVLGPWHIRENAPYVKDEVGMYPLSDDYSDIFHLPGNIEDSFLLAAVDICNYYLSRPVRYCAAYSPSDIEHGINYDDNTWQKMVMDNAEIFRAKLELAYSEIWNIFGSRLVALGVEKVNYVRDNTPFGQFVPGDGVWADRNLSPEQRELRNKGIEAVLAELRKVTNPGAGV